jgi:mono/diheme cytochrome c family protein
VLCHTLADAGSTAEIGPNLDELKPTAEQVAAAVGDGVGVMPAYQETLTEEQIAAVAAYVAEATGTAE